MLSPDPARIIADPDWLPLSFKADGRTLRFVRVTEVDRASLPFLGSEELATWPEQMDLDTRAVEAEVRDLPPSPLHFIFHGAFCGSTLLASALQATGQAAILKEPGILLNLLHFIGQGENVVESGRLRLILQLLARPHGGAGTVVVKPSCFALPLVPILFSAERECRGMFLSSDLRTFLYSTAKRGLRGRSWGRQVYSSVGKYLGHPLPYSLEDVAEQTDLQVAGLGWLARNYHAARFAKAFGPRFTMMDSHDVFDRPERAIRAAAAKFGLVVRDEAIERVVHGDVFARHSKENRPFDRHRRGLELAVAVEQHREEVETVARWIEKAAEAIGFRIAVEERLPLAS